MFVCLLASECLLPLYTEPSEVEDAADDTESLGVVDELAELGAELPGEGEELGHLQGQADGQQQQVRGGQRGKEHVRGALTNLVKSMMDRVVRAEMWKCYVGDGCVKEFVKNLFSRFLTTQFSFLLNMWDPKLDFFCVCRWKARIKRLQVTPDI